MEHSKQEDLSHHKRLEYCTNRPRYRDGRKLTAVKVYTIVNESRHLLVFGVPRINLYQEVKQLCSKYGTISSIKGITDELKPNNTVEIEQFTDCYHVEYDKLHCARRAKHMIDRKNFYGGNLHVSYAPEYENIADVREKFKSRASDIRYRMKKLKESCEVHIKNPTFDDEHEPPRKRRHTFNTNLSTE